MRDKVIPNLEHVPERSYTRVGGIITCREVTSFESGLDPTVSEGQVLFILCLSVKKAETLMEDLYYGQYTGN